MLFSRASKLILFAVASLAAFPAVAGVLYSSLPNLNVSSDGNVWYSSECTDVQCHLVFDNFSLGSASTITEVKISVEGDYSLSEDLPYLGILFWTDSGGMPGAEFFGEGFGPPGFSYSETEFGTTIVTVSFFSYATLSAGNYWIAFASLDPLGIPGYAGGSGSLLTVSTAYPYTFVPTGDSAGFTILGGPPGVPESSTWALLLLGLAGLGVVRNKRLRPSSPIS
jgi:hypothetical protein